MDKESYMSTDKTTLTPKQKAQEARKKYEKSRRKITVRYTTDELTKVNGFAERAGQDLRTYIQSVSLNPRFKIMPAIPKVNIETKAQILKIGVNLNQIARAMNNYYETKNFDRIEVNLRKISDELHTILNTLRA